MDFTDPELFVAEDYEYGVQMKWNDDWHMAGTNHFPTGWYENQKGAKNALVQLRATRWGRPSRYEYRPVRRPVGPVEVVDES